MVTQQKPLNSPDESVVSLSAVPLAPPTALSPLADQRGMDRVVWLPREQVTVPICPAPELIDTVLFEDAKQLDTKYYLPRYRIATVDVFGRPRYRVALKQEGQGGALAIELEKYPPEELGLDTRQAREIEHVVEASLSYRVASAEGKNRRVLTFDEVAKSEKGLLLIRHLPTLDDLTQMYQAMTDASYETNLSLSRNVAVALTEREPGSNPIVDKPVGLPTISAELPNPLLNLSAAENFMARGVWYRRFHLQIENWSAYPDQLFAPAPDLPPCGNIANAARTWVSILTEGGQALNTFCLLKTAQDLQNLWFVVPQGQSVPTDIYVQLSDRRQNVTWRSDGVPTAEFTTSAKQVAKVNIHTRRKQAEGVLSLSNIKLMNLSPGDTVSLILAFPDQPFGVFVEATTGDPSGIDLELRPAGASSADSGESTDGEIFETLPVQVETQGDLAFGLKNLSLVTTDNGQVSKISISLRAPTPAKTTKLQALTVSFTMPTTVGPLLPLAPNQSLAVTELRWQQLFSPLVPLYGVGPSYSLANPGLPFIFPEKIHDYIYQGVVGDADNRAGLIQWPQPWKNRPYIYFQDAIRPHLFYYLPDSFKLARNENAPFYPKLRFQYRENEQGGQFNIHYTARPFINQARIAAAVQEFRSKIFLLPSDAQGLRLEPLLAADKLRFQLALPQTGETTVNLERHDALISLGDGIQDALILDPVAGLEVLDAMYSAAPFLFQGHVEIELGKNPIPPIPFIAQMNNLAGEIFTYTEQADAASGGVSVTLRNAIESPVRIRALQASLQQANEGPMINAEIRDMPLPLELAPNATVSCIVAPLAQVTVPGDVALHAVFAFDQVEVLPDQEALAKVIFDDTTSESPVHAIKVEISANVFEPRDQPDSIIAIQIKFSTGEFIEFNVRDCKPGVASYMLAVKLRLSILDYLLHRANVDQYRYQISVIRRDEIIRADWSAPISDVSIWLIKTDLPIKPG